MAERPIGIDFITVLGMPPLEYVALAAQLGCATISMANNPITANPHGYPAWSLRDDPALRRDLLQALKDNDIRISAWEGCLLLPGMSASAFAADLDMVAELGIPNIVGVGIDPDPVRTLAELGSLAELAKERGLRTLIEFIPSLVVNDIAAGLEAIARIDVPNMALVIDCMHLFRGGGGLDALRALDPDLIGHSQICDVMLHSTMNYGEEAAHERLSPGEGELPLAQTYRILPRTVSVALEIPMVSRAQQGIDPVQRLSGAVEATRAILAGLDG